MAVNPYASGRRKRRRRWLLVILLVLSVGLVLGLAVRYRTERRGVADYFAVAEEVAAAEVTAADDLEAMLASVASIDRPEMLRRLAMLDEEMSEASATLTRIDVPGPVAEAHGFLVAATGSWHRAVSVLDEAIISVLDDPLEAGGEGALEEAFDLLRLGDVAYVEFLKAVSRVDPALRTREFTPLAFSTADRSVPYDAQLLALRLRGVYRLGERRDVSVTAITSPEPVGTNNGIAVVPFSEDFVVQAVVANEGNELEESVAVVLDLVPADGGDDALRLRQTVAALEPGQARTLVFDAIVLRPGGVYELIVSTGVDNDAESGNDEWRMVFERNENV